MVAQLVFTLKSLELRICIDKESICIRTKVFLAGDIPDFL